MRLTVQCTAYIPHLPHLTRISFHSHTSHPFTHILHILSLTYFTSFHSHFIPIHCHTFSYILSTLTLSRLQNSLHSRILSFPFDHLVYWLRNVQSHTFSQLNPFILTLLTHQSFLICNYSLHKQYCSRVHPLPSLLSLEIPPPRVSTEVLFTSGGIRNFLKNIRNSAGFLQ